MKVIDPGHKYEMDLYDLKDKATTVPEITFMKREGAGYPGNVGINPGTNCQEVLRVLIDRMKYLDNQVGCYHNKIVLQKLRECLWMFESRAATQHGIEEFDFVVDYIELRSVCKICGHIVCEGHS
jgi:hypothetical protein